VPSFKSATVVVAATVALGFALSGPASASATDFANAVVSDSSDIANATLTASIENVGSPDISCANPTAAGTTITPATDAHPVGTVDGNDIGNGTGQCVSLQGSAYSATLVTRIEYLEAGTTSTWLPISGCTATTTTPAFDGVATPVNPEVPCNYPATAAWAFQPHRVHSILTNSLTTNHYNGYSIVYNDLELGLSVSSA
jgi:hypothetical protein